jgi:dihydrofolate reductase
MTTAHIFIAISLDGFIARTDGDIEWLLSRDDPAEDHGYNAFIADKDMIVMGRGSYEKVLGFDPWPYDRPVLVMSQALAGTPVPDALQGKLRFSNRSPKDLMAELTGQGVDRIYLDGGRLVQAFLREGLVSDIVLTTVPVLIGAGRPLFGALTADVDLRLVESRAFPSGLVQSTYQIVTA